MIRRLAIWCLLFQSTAYSQTFEEYCEKVEELSYDQRRIVFEVLGTTGTDCANAEQALNESGELVLHASGLRDISLLSSLRGIRDLTFLNANISEIAPLAKLEKLESLYIGYYNNVSDIRALAGLTNLKDLRLPGNAIKDITPLRNLVQLERLHLAGNPVQDYSSLKKMVHLKHLKVGEAKYQDNSRCPSTARNAESTAAAESLERVLKGFRELRGIVSRGINFKSLDSLESHPDLRYVIVECASIEKTRAFAVWPKLESLVLAHNRIDRIDPPKTMREMGHINLSGNFLDNARFLEKISDANVIDLSDNLLTGEFSLRSLPSLSILNLSGNQLKYFDLKGDHPKLREIDVSNNILAYIQFANSSHKVQYLDASNNRLTNPAAGFNLNGIIELHLQNNLIADYSFVNAIEPLDDKTPRLLDLGGNLGRDFSVISHPTISMFYAEGSQLSSIEELPNLPELFHLSIARNNFTHLDGLGAKYSGLMSLNAADNPLARLDRGEGSSMVLSRLNLSRTKIRSFKFLEKQYMVYDLKLSGNRIVDLSPIKRLRELQSLDLSHNKIEDLSHLTENMTKLHTVNLSDNQIYDTSPLGKLERLDTPSSLLLDQNPLGTTVAKTSENCPTQSASSALNTWCSQK